MSFEYPEEWVALQRLLHCMKEQEDILPNQSWQSLLLRAQMAQDLWKVVSSDIVTLDLDLYQRISQDVDHCCRRAQELANRHQSSAETKTDLIEDIFFSSATTSTPILNAEESLSADKSQENFFDEEDTSNSDVGEDDQVQKDGNRHQTTSTNTSVSFQELQQQQREQMEEAISDMARHMKEATQGLNATLQQQTSKTLNELETVAEQNVQDVTQVSQNVQTHNRKAWKKNLSTWTMMFTIVGVFFFSLMTIFTIPKDPSATLVGSEGMLTKGGTFVSSQIKILWQQLMPFEELQQNGHLDTSQWDSLYQENEEERLQKKKMQEFMANHGKNDPTALDRTQRQTKEGNRFGKPKSKDKERSGDSDDNPFGRKPLETDESSDDDDDNPFGSRSNEMGKKQDTDNSNPFGRKPIDIDTDTANPFGRKPVHPKRTESKTANVKDSGNTRKDNPWGRDPEPEANIVASVKMKKKEVKDDNARNVANNERRRIEKERQEKAERERKERLKVERMKIEEQERLERERLYREEQERFEREREEQERLNREHIKREEEEYRRKAVEMMQQKEKMRQWAQQAELEARQREQGTVLDMNDYVEAGRSRLDSVLQSDDDIESLISETGEASFVAEEDDSAHMTDYVEAGRSRLNDLLGPEDDEDNDQHDEF